MATGISFEHSGPQLSVGDHVEITVVAVIPDSELPIAKDSTPSAMGEFKILFTGRVVGSYPAQLSDAQRLGLVIDNFASEADANNYAHLLHHPSRLLRGEEIFHPPESLANIPEH